MKNECRCPKCILENNNGICDNKSCCNHQEPVIKEFTKGYNRGFKAGQEEYRQFILNILDGIDIVDKNFWFSDTGTKAIRFAIESKVI